MWVLVRRRDRFLERGVFFGQGGKRCPVVERKNKRGGGRKMCEWNDAEGWEKFFDGVILFKEYFDVLGEYLCGEKTERGVWRKLPYDAGYSELSGRAPANAD